MYDNETGRLVCDMRRDCMGPVTHVDTKGWAYCTEHGRQRQQSQPCRKLRPHEVNRLQRGEALKAY